MARIKTNDLPTNKKINKKDMNKILGGKYIGETEKNVSLDFQMELQDAVQVSSNYVQLVSDVMNIQNDEDKAIIDNIR